MHSDRADLPPMPIRIARLPRDHRGFPVPWFVAWFKDGKAVGAREEGAEPDFRIADASKLHRAARAPLCWVCGETMGAHRVFTIGPMCAINRVIGEPPAHRECAEFSVKACPFLSRPRMRRNEVELPSERQEAGGFPIKRNPGVICLWETRDYRAVKAEAGNAGILFNLGDPTRVDWYTQGRPASRGEVLDAIMTGLPALLHVARLEGPNAVWSLQDQERRVMKYLPKEAAA